MTEEMAPAVAPELEGKAFLGLPRPVFVLSAVSFLKKNPHPTDAEIIHGMTGNICRCGTHPRIVEAIRKASAKMRSAAK